ncbi:hypothetical protein NE237_004035 [Protea cynaroides]|uniref:Uncharacterized protein n=1 Tax=Protea cynaroides TaxID=273540 RepID=A0A9Q0KIK2_9MAGN|nr:hypothetical protein NE237_004035 [Protea cynaroides]
MRKLFYPDFVTLCTLLPVVVKSGWIQDAFKIAQKIFYQAGYEADRTSWENLMEGILCDAGVELFIIFAESLVSAAVCKDDSILSPLLKSLCSHGKAIDDHKLFDKFRKQYGITTTLEVYNSVMDGLLEAQLTEIAWALFEDMKAATCAPNIFT